MTKIVLYIGRHPDNSCFKIYRQLFGNDVKVVTKDLRYGKNPASTVHSLIQSFLDSGEEIVCVEATGPLSVLKKLDEASGHFCNYFDVTFIL